MNTRKRNGTVLRLDSAACGPVLMAAPKRRAVTGRCARPGCSCSGWCARFAAGRGRPGTGPGRTGRSAARRGTRSPALLHRTATGRSRHA
ncbi:hypothetical protein ABZ249_00700 [Nocardiopsis sp. NPDC006139]|uniref:hypothetical protein n=1 Tax=Nocardiopsis TaxID=2013 RepID=UPI0033B573A5